MDRPETYTSFAGHRRIATGELDTTLIATKGYVDGGGPEAVLVFDDRTGASVDFDLRGSVADVLARLPAHPGVRARRGPGRPKLGVVAREITLLPRHWAWLEERPEGVSAALRRLVEEASKRDPARDAARAARDAAGKFMWALAGDLPGFEEASRALYAGDRAALTARMKRWPKDVREHVLRLFEPSGAGDAGRGQ